MSATVCKFSIRWTDAGSSSEQSIDFDASINEGYESATEVTEHAVESGSNVSDNIRPKNETFTVEALITNTPIQTPTFGMSGASGSTQSASVTVGGQTLTAQTFQFSQRFDRVAAVDTQLRALCNARTRVTVNTGVRVIADCAITRYKWDRAAETGKSLALSMEFSRLRTAKTEQVAAPAQRRQHQTPNRGAQPAVVDNSSAAIRAAIATGLAPAAP